jgi:ABC-type uncharacterized transport system permease subunit
MILSSSVSSTTALALAALALLAYGLAALFPGRSGDLSHASGTSSVRLPALALAVGVASHTLWLMLDIGSVGSERTGVRLGFAPVASLTMCLTLIVHTIESRFVQLPSVRRALGWAGAMSVALAVAFPGEVRTLGSPWAPVHWLLGVAAYGLFGVAVLHAMLLDGADRRLRLRKGPSQGVQGLPLLQLERLTFLFVQAGFWVLTAAIVLGIVTAPRWRWDHKTVLSLLGWGIFAALLLGRHVRGWRGRQATRWLYAGTLVLLLAYVGSRFVMEVLLGRSAG